MGPPHRAWVAIASTAVLVVAGCSAGVPLASQSAAVLASPPASPGPGLATAPPCPNFVEVVETGPMPGDDGTEDGPVAREQQRLSADIDAAIAYGAAHADEYASIRYENGPRVRIVVGFTAHIEEHCAALRGILEYPDEFEIIRQPATEAQLEQIQQDLTTRYRDKLVSVGRGAGVLHLALRADGEEDAADVWAEYGDLVQISVGMLPYPDPFAGAPDCGALSRPILEDSPFSVVLTLNTATVRSGADFRATAIVTNTSGSIATLETGQPLTAMILGRGSTRVIGGYTGGVAGTGLGGELAPGASLDIDVLGGTASCEPALGYALPPGSYDVRALVDQYMMHDDAPTEISYLLSEPAPLTIVP